MKRAAFVIGLAACVVSGCGAAPPAIWLGQSRRGEGVERETTFRGELETWTRRGESYEGFEGRLFVHATLFSPRFIARYAEHRAERESWTAERLASTQVADAAHVSAHTRALVALVPQDGRWDDLGHDGTFHPTLTVDGHAFESSAVVRISDDDLADLALYFPYLSSLSTAYWVDFPALKTPRELELQIAGPPGVVTVAWTIK